MQSVPRLYNQMTGSESSEERGTGGVVKEADSESATPGLNSI
jgi:hypothetical protein